jgi:hypothetical protein
VRDDFIIMHKMKNPITKFTLGRIMCLQFMHCWCFKYTTGNFMAVCAHDFETPQEICSTLTPTSLL